MSELALAAAVREHVLGTLDQIPRGEGRNFVVAGRTVAVFRTHADEVFASQPECPHRNGPLADGILGGTILVCPLHDRAFDLRTGASLADECGLAVFPARVTAQRMIVLTLPA